MFGNRAKREDIVQCYVATLGNRQQSRFIALVDNYSRLSELTEEAANAQDAGTLQYLKTLDSIESKLNQVQVAFQQFYTSMGLETIFKGALDTATAVINTLNSLPKIFDKIPAAALSMGASLIIAVKHIIKLLAVPLYTELKTLKNKIGELTGANYKLQFHVDSETAEKEARETAQKVQTAAQDELNKKSVKLSISDALRQSKTAQILGSTITAGMNIAAASFLTKENKSTENVESGKVLSGAFGTAGNILGGFLTGGWIGALAGVVKSVGYIATLFDGLDYDINERRKVYEKEIQELENESIKKNNEAKTIDQTIKKLEELAKVRWASNEANQEYLDYIEKIKESNPELLSSFDLEKNAILDSTKAYEALTKAKQEAAEVDVKLAEKNYQLANLELEYVTQNTELTSLFTKAFNEYSQTEANWTELKESVKSNQTIDPNQVSFITANENLISFYRKYKKNPEAEGVQSVLTQKDASGQNVLGQTLFDLIAKNDNFHFSDIFSKVINPEDEGKYSTFSDLKNDIQDYYGAENSIILMLEYVTKNAAEFAEELEHMGDDLAKKNIALNNINNINNFELNTPISNRQRLAFIGSDNLTNFVANNIKNTDEYKKSKKQNLSEYYLANRELFEETTAQYTQELLSFYSTLDSESKELFLSELGNATHYSSAASYINTLGIEDTTSELYKSLVINWNAIVSDVYEEANDIIKELPDEYQKRYKSIIKWDPDNNKANISADFLAQLNNGMQAVNDFYNQGMKATAKARFTAIEKLWTSVAGKEDLQQLIAGVDLTSQDELINLRNTLQEAEEDNSDTINAITQLLNTFIINSNTVVESFLNSLKTGAETADKFFKKLSSGFDYADLFEELTQLQVIDPNLTLESAFEYNAALKKYIYTTNGLNAAYNSAFKNVTTEYNQQIEHAEELKKQIQEVRLKEDDTEWRTTYATLLEGYGSLDNAEKEYEKLINNLDNAYQFQLANYFNHLLNSIDYSNEQIFELFGTTIEQYALALGKDIDVKQLLDTFKEGGEKAVELYSELIGDAFDSETATTLYQGQSGVRARIAAVNKVIELKVGDIIDANTAKLAGLLDEDSQASYVLINSAEQLIDVANNLYTELAKKYAKSAIQLNDLLDARDQALEQNIKDARAIEATISGASNLNTSTIREFEDALKIQILDNMGNVLDEYSNYITRTGLESWAVTDFSLFDNLQQANVDSSYQKYLEEARFIAEKSLGESIVNLAKTISESSKGEKINVRFLPKTIQDALGATNGVLEIAEKSQAELINNLMEASTNALATLPQGMAQVADILTEYYNAIISLTEGGIGGTLSEVDKQKLVDAANGQGLQLTDEDFTKTLKGYKLTTDAALKLQAITKGTTYSTLIESLIETDDKYKTIQDTLRTQKQLEDQKAAAEQTQNQEQIKALDKQIQLTKEIVRTQSLKNTASYDFMNRNNEYFGAPTNYFNSISTALEKWKAFSEGKLLNPQDLENILIELNNLVIRDGTQFTDGLEFFGVKLDGSSKAVTNAFQKMMEGLTVTSDGVGISLAKLGSNFTFGMDDMAEAFDDGIKTLAQKNIDMLDSIIKTLEMVQALQDINTTDNPQEFINKAFGLYQDMPDDVKEILDKTLLTLNNRTQSIATWIKEFYNGDYIPADLDAFSEWFKGIEDLDPTLDWSTITWEQFTGLLVSLADGFEDLSEAASDTADNIDNTQEAIENLKNTSLGDPTTGSELDLTGYDDEAEKVRKKLQQEYATRKKAEAGDQVYSPDQLKEFADNQDNSTLSKILAARSAARSEKKELETELAETQTQLIEKEKQLAETQEQLADAQRQLAEAQAPAPEEPPEEPKEYQLKITFTEDTSEGVKELITNQLVEADVQLGDTTDTIYITALPNAPINFEVGQVTGLTPNSDNTYTFTATVNGDPINFTLANPPQAKWENDRWVLEGITNDGTSVSWALSDEQDGKLSWDNENGWQLATIKNDGTVVTFQVSNTDLEGSMIWNGTSWCLKHINGGKTTIESSLTGFSYHSATKTWTANFENGSLTVIPDSIDWTNAFKDGDIIPNPTGEGFIINGKVYGNGVELKVDKIDGLEPDEDNSGQWVVKIGDATIPLMNYTVPEGSKFTEKNGQIYISIGGQEVKITGLDTSDLIKDGYFTKDGNVYYWNQDCEVTIEAYLDTKEAEKKLRQLRLNNGYGTRPETYNKEELQDYASLVEYIKNKYSDIKDVEDLMVHNQDEQNTLNFDVSTLQEYLIESVQRDEKNPNSEWNQLNNLLYILEQKQGQLLYGFDTEPTTSTNQTDSLNLEEFTEQTKDASDAAQDAGIQLENTELTIDDVIAVLINYDNTLDESQSTLKGSIGAIINYLNAVKESNGVNKNIAISFNEVNKAILEVDDKLNNQLIPTILRLGGLNINNGGGPGSAKGNVALARGTLMGELGPELFVTGGHYYIAGQSGAEFVNLPDDAIVFNHLQTARLMGSGHAGRGKAVTNEHKATSMATGTPKGEAKASVSDTLAKLYDLRAMWQAILDLGSQDLGKLAGGSGGGGGKEQAAINKEIERWYNLLRQIANLEKQITLEQQKRNNLVHGGEIYNSYRKELDMLEAELKRQKELNALQKDWYDRKREDLATSEIGKYIFTYDENGLMQYRDGRNLGLDILENLTRVDANENAVDEMDTTKKQLQYLESIGFDISTLAGDDEGAKVQDFFSKIDAQMKEMDSLWDEFVDGQNSVEKLVEKQNSILETIQKNQIDLENKILDSIVERQQQMIDAAQAERDAISDSNQRFLNGLSEQLSKERELYDRNEDDEELRKLQRQLAILQRSGGSSSQIRSLQEQITNRQQERYFQAQQDQIDAVQEASDLEIDRLDRQINLMTETLEYQKENGLFWGEVTELLSTSPENIAQFIAAYNPDFAANSATANAVEFADLIKMAQIYVADREEGNRKLNETNAWEAYSNNLSSKYFASGGILDTSSPMGQRHLDSLEERYRAAYLAESGKYEDFNDNPQAQTAAAQAGAKAAEAYLKTLLEDANLSSTVNNNVSAGSSNGSSGGSETSSTTTSSTNSEIEKLKKDEDKALRVINTLSEIINSKMKLRDDAKRLLDQKQDELNKAYINDANILTINRLHDEYDKLKANWIYYRDAYNDAATAYGGRISEQQANLRDIRKKLKALGVPGYKQGGLITYTGPAIVHGSKQHPEGVLSAEALEQLRNTMLTSIDLNDSIIALQNGLNRSVNNIRNINNSNNTDGVYIDNLTLQLNPGTISSDYDARRAADMVMEEVMKIASKSGVRSVSRR